MKYYLNTWFLCVSLVILLCASTCRPTGKINVGTDNGTNLTAGVGVDVTTNINVGATGAYNPVTGTWSAGIVITFKSEPLIETSRLALAAGAVRVQDNRDGFVRYVITKVDLKNQAQKEFILACDREGAEKTELVVHVQ